MTHQNPLSRRFTQLIAGTAGFALTAMVAGTAVAGPPQGERGGGHRGGMVCKKLECTDAQREELRDIAKEFRTDSKAEHEALKKTMESIAAEFAKDQPNEVQLKRWYAEIQKRQANLIDRRHDMMMEIHGVLTPEQRKTVSAHLAKRLMRVGKPGHHGDKNRKGGNGNGNGNDKTPRR